MNRIIIIGASGHGKVVADIAKRVGYTDIVFLDKDTSVSSFCGFPVMGTEARLSDLDGDVFVAVGDGAARKKIMLEYKKRFFTTLIHPAAVVAEDVITGKGTAIMAGAVINSGTRIGEGVIINTSSSVDHDCDIHDFCHIAVGAHLAGTVSVGENTWIGVGAVVSNNISICSECMIGAGAVVVKDIVISGTYVGVPARINK